MKRIVILSTLLCLAMSSWSQETAFPIISKKKSEEVVLRWAPSNAAYWLQLQRADIWIERRDVDPDTEKVIREQRVVSDTFQVWQEVDFQPKENGGAEEDWTMLAGYLMHAPYESLSDTSVAGLGSLIKQEEELSNRFAAALYAAERSPEAATALAMRWSDIAPSPDLIYIYTLYVQVDSTLIYHSPILVDAGFKEKFRPKINKKREEDGFVVFSWDKNEHDQHFSSYWIERSKDGMQWERLTPEPYVHAQQDQSPLSSNQLTYIDSVTNGESHWYRIIGLDAFGDLSEPSDPIRLQGRDRTPPPAPQKVKAFMPNEEEMVLEWEGSPKEPKAELSIRKSNRSNGVFSQISPWLSASENTWTDTSPSMILTNYYKVCARDSARNISCSPPIYGIVQDTFPPAAPEGLTASVDSAGVVHLQWRLGKEEDLKGYHVYFANGYDRVFSILTGTAVIDTQYRDTIALNSLTKQVFYRVVAEDLRSNRSAFSSIIAVQRPDNIPPSAAVFKNYQVKDNGINLSWANSSSKDVSHQIVLRRLSKQDNFRALDTLRPTATYFVDTLIQEGQNYIYRILTQDHQGWSTPSPHDLFVRSKKLPISLLLSSREENGTHIIEFTLPESVKSTDKIKLYKSLDSEPYYSWQTIPADRKKLEIQIQDSVQIKAMVLQASGRKSAWSNTLILNPQK